MMKMSKLRIVRFIASVYIEVIRGTPILPWDFKALSTAVAVAGSYSLSMTWQIAICIMLVALLAWALRPYYKMGHFRPRKGVIHWAFRKRQIAEVLKVCP